MAERPWATWLFLGGAAAAAALSLLVPDRLKVTEARAEEWAMVVMLPVCLYVIYALKRTDEPPSPLRPGSGQAGEGDKR